MDKNGTSNGKDPKPKLETSPPASKSGNGKGTGTKRRRKVNHGTSSRPSSNTLSLKQSQQLLTLERVPAACVYCRRSVSTALGANTRGKPWWMHLCVGGLAKANLIWYLLSI